MVKEKEFLTAKTDRVFKAILGDEDNKDLLRKFLERIFKTKVEIIEFLQPELIIETTKERTKTVDLLVKMNEKFVHIEMNSQNKDYLHNRNFIFFTSIFNKKTGRGKEYDIKTEYIHIDFTYGLSQKEEDYREYYMMDRKGKKYIENLKIIEYNMSKITNYYEKEDEGDDFVEEFDKKLEELNERETYEPFLSYEEDQLYCFNTEKRMAREEGHAEGHAEGLQEGLQEGLKEGIKEGINNRNIEIAKNLLDINTSIEVISKVTGLSIEEINKL